MKVSGVKEIDSSTSRGSVSGMEVSALEKLSTSIVRSKQLVQLVQQKEEQRDCCCAGSTFQNCPLSF